MAGRPRLPQEVAKITGATAKNPQMFRDRAAPKVKSLGPAPKWFTPEQVELWDEINADFPWLGRPDRQLVTMAVELRSMIDEGGAPVSVYAQLRLCLSSMGGTPVDRSKVAAPDEDEADALDEFVN